jgi:hypothetical protein
MAAFLPLLCVMLQQGASITRGRRRQGAQQVSMSTGLAFEPGQWGRMGSVDSQPPASGKMSRSSSGNNISFPLFAPAGSFNGQTLMDLNEIFQCELSRLSPPSRASHRNVA